MSPSGSPFLDEIEGKVDAELVERLREHPPVRVVDVRCHVLVDPERDVTATSSSQDTFLVELHGDNGLVGWGEADINPHIGRAHLEAPGCHPMALSLKELLLGCDSRHIPEIWRHLYVHTAMTNRRGSGINVIGAIDIALHDLRAKSLGVPIWKLLGKEVKQHATPYASLQPDTSDLEEYGRLMIEEVSAVQAQGFTAAKMAMTLDGPFAHRGMRVNGDWTIATEMLRALRKAIGDEFTLMVDMQYAFRDADEAIPVLRQWEDLGLYFVETPLWVDDLEGSARVAAEQSIPIASGEWLSTRFEFDQLMRDGGIRVAQPDIGRVGGLSEAMKVAQAASDRGLTVIPHLWKSGLSVAAALHFAAVTDAPFVEYLPADQSDSLIRKELTDDFEFVDGRVVVPTIPGLGLEPRPAALERFRDTQLFAQ